MAERCQVCKTRVATMKCRRCMKPICSICHFHHGLCRDCRAHLR